LVESKLAIVQELEQRILIQKLKIRFNEVQHFADRGGGVQGAGSSPIASRLGRSENPRTGRLIILQGDFRRMEEEPIDLDYYSNNEGVDKGALELLKRCCGNPRVPWRLTSGPSFLP
jgi:hypothetical protein